VRFARLPLLIVLVVAAIVAAGEPAHAAPDDRGYDRQWGMHLIGAETAWATGTGQGITVAVVDTGFYFGHEDFAPGKVLPGRNFVEDGKPPADDAGHGTHVAGIIAASTNNERGVVGVAPDARILPVRVLAHDAEHGATGTSDDLKAGIRWAVDNGAHVVNLSLGEKSEDLFGPEMLEAIRYAWARGVICVVASGNDGADDDPDNDYYSDPRTGSLLRDEKALVVSATNRADGKPTYATGVGGANWGLAAPGGDGSGEDAVISTYWTSANNPSTYAFASGTSMAAPHVAGAAAILRGLGLSPDQTVRRLLDTAKDIGEPGRDSTFGRGRLDLAKAVSGLPPAPGGSSATRVKGTTSGSTTTTLRRGTTNSTRAPSGSGAPSTEPGAAAGVGSTDTTVVAGASLDIVPAGPGAVLEPDHEAGSSRRGGRKGDESLPWPPPLLATGLLLAVSGGIVRVRRA
jgi:subtilisin family serine protease